MNKSSLVHDIKKTVFCTFCQWFSCKVLLNILYLYPLLIHYWKSLKLTYYKKKCKIKCENVGMSSDYSFMQFYELKLLSVCLQHNLGMFVCMFFENYFRPNIFSIIAWMHSFSFRERLITPCLKLNKGGKKSVEARQSNNVLAIQKLLTQGALLGKQINQVNQSFFLV